MKKNNNLTSQVLKENTLHIFWLHSHITWIISQKIIQHHELKPENILLLINRNYNNLDPLFHKLNKINLTEIYFDKGLKKYHQTRKSIRSFNDIILPIINSQKFELYIPQSKIDAISILIEHKCCSNFHYIEEGMLSYESSKFTNKSRWYFRPILFAFGLSSIQHSYKQNFFLPSHSKLRNFYSISEHCFPQMNNHIVLNKSLDLPIEDHEKKIEAILIFDAIVSYKMITMEYLSILLKTKIFPQITKNNYKVIHYKFHPEQYNHPEEIKELTKILSNSGFIFKELDSNFIVENRIFRKDLPIDLFCFVSTLSIYGVISSNRVYSLLNHLVKDGKFEKIKFPHFQDQWISL